MKTLRSSLPLLIAAVCVVNAPAATGPNVALISPSSGFSPTFSNVTVQSARSGIFSPVSPVMVNFGAVSDAPAQLDSIAKGEESRHSPMTNGF